MVHVKQVLPELLAWQSSLAAVHCLVSDLSMLPAAAVTSSVNKPANCIALFCSIIK